MGLSKTIKMNAKRALAGAWGSAIGVMVITFLPSIMINILESVIRAVSGVPEFVDYAATPSIAFDDMANVAAVSTLISLLVSVLIFFVMTPLQQGCARWFYRRTGGEQEPVSGVFLYFETAKSYFRSLGLNFQIGLRVFLWLLLPALPMAATIVFVVFYKHQLGGNLPNAVFAVVVILMVIWAVLLVILSILISLRYFLAPYLLAEHPEQKASQCIKSGVRLVKGHKAELFGFILSFIGWGLLCIFIIPIFYVMPYMQSSYAMYARYLIQLGEEAGSDNTKEYLYKPDIDRYMEEQAARGGEMQEPSSDSFQEEEPRYPGV